MGSPYAGPLLRNVNLRTHLPDGTCVPRLPGYQRWMWDGAFAGSIGFRWQYGTVELPS